MFSGKSKGARRLLPPIALGLLLCLPPPSFARPLPELHSSPLDAEADMPALSLFEPSSLTSPAPDLSAFENRAILLCWHTFLGDPGLDTDFSKAELAAQLDAIRALGYSFIDLADLLAGRFEGPLNVVATIDDGHKTVPQAVEKVFLPRGIRPALFIYPAIIGTLPYAMDDAALRRMSELGCLVGAHGYHHLYVTEALYKSEPAEFRKEVYKAKSGVEKILDLPVTLYAYPFGAYSDITIDTVARAGYAYSIAVKPGFVYTDGLLNQDYELPRYVVTRAKWPELLALLKRNAAPARPASLPLLSESCLLPPSSFRESR